MDFTKQKLQAFNNDAKRKEILLNQVNEWLQNQLAPKSAVQMAAKIFSPVRSFESSELALEDYGFFEEHLGLPRWLLNLLLCINHHNSNNFDGINFNYEEEFYPKFVSACRVGVDYTLMFHQWEIWLLTKMLPEQEKDKSYILETIQLHERAISKRSIDILEWKRLSNEINVMLGQVDEIDSAPREVVKKEIDAFDLLSSAKNSNNGSYQQLHSKAYEIQARRKSYAGVIQNSGRVALLSLEDGIDPKNSYTSSAEAVVDANWQQAVKGGALVETKRDFEKSQWGLIMDKLIDVLQNWEQPI